MWVECMYVNVFSPMHVYMCSHPCMCVLSPMCECECMRACVCILTHACMCVLIYVWVHESIVCALTHACVCECMSECLCMCSHSCICACAGVFVCSRARGWCHSWCHMSSSLTLHFSFWGRVSVNLELADSAGLAHDGAHRVRSFLPPPPALGLYVLAATHDFYIGAGESDPSPHAHTANTLPSPGPPITSKTSSTAKKAKSDFFSPGDKHLCLWPWVSSFVSLCCELFLPRKHGYRGAPSFQSYSEFRMVWCKWTD